MMKKMNKLKKAYDRIDIPVELEDVVNDTIRQTKAMQKKRMLFRKWTIGVAVAMMLFIGSLNLSPAMAQSMMHIPILGNIVEVVTIEKMSLHEKTYDANLSSPSIQGLEDKDLEASLNEMYLEENKALFKEFKEEIAEMKQAGGGHMGIDAGYEVLTDTDRILSIARYEVTTAASSSTTMKYDTIDKQDNVLITLPSLFKDEQYIDTINSYIVSEMKRQMEVDPEVSYFIEGDFTGDFVSIAPDQDFYITTDHTLVISFDAYEVAPGYMGVVTFEIPSDLLRDQLVSATYIR